MKKNMICIIAGVIIGLAIAIAFGVGLIVGKSGKSASEATAIVVSGNGTDQNSQDNQNNNSNENGNSNNNSNENTNGSGLGNQTSGDSSAGTSADSQSQSGSSNSNSGGTASDSGSTSGEEITTASVTATRSNNWGENGNYYAQFDITVKNEGSSEIDNWTMQISADGLKEITQAWNCEVSSGTFTLTPVQYNQKLAAGSETAGMGIIINSSKELESINVKVMTAGSSSSGDSTQGGADSSVNSGSTGTAGATGNSGSAGTTGATVASVSKSTATTNAQGKLHVSGTSLMDSSGNAVQLKGVSTHGLAWYPEYVNKAAFQTLHDDWGANVIRLAMYTDEYGGYCNGGDKDKLKSLIDDGVSYATELGMYVIIDWHILNDNNPQTHKSEAIEFFDEMSAKYADNPNVIYEICNEPHGVSWNNDIKPYAEEVLKVIRSHTDAVVLVGTNTWSQDVDDVIGNALSYDNVMYVAHFYAATHKEAIRDKISKALAAGIPVFVSECSICDASGNGSIDEASANTWLSFMNENGISFVAWSLSNKNETSALINSSCSKTSGWTDDDLSQCGKWFKSAIKG